MNSGKLRFKISIQSPVDTIDENGAAVLTFQTFAEVWADIRTQSGREFMAQQSTSATAAHVVYIRWLNGITEKMRILWGTRILNIVYVGEDLTHARMLSIACEEIK